MPARIGQRHDFDREFEEKSEMMLDTIFESVPDLRPLVTLRNPRECNPREVIFKVSYQDTDEFSAALYAVCDWLKDQTNHQHLEGLMLY